MSATVTKEEQTASEFVTIRIPADLALFVNQQAAAMCNTRAGVIRYALSQLREAVESEEKHQRPAAPAAQLEEVGA